VIHTSDGSIYILSNNQIYSQDFNLVKTSRLRLHQNFQDSRLELKTEACDFKSCAFCQNFSKKCHHNNFSIEFFLISDIFL